MSWISCFLSLVLMYGVPKTLAAETCYDGIVTDLTAYQASTTYLRTPSYPNGYPVNFKCGVRITAENVTIPIKIRVLNSSLDKVDDSPTCTRDFAEIYDGHDPSYPSLVKWCGDSTPSVTTTGQFAFFYFQTDSIISDDEGLELEFTQGTLAELPTTAAPVVVIDTGPSGGAIAGGVIGGLAGLILLILGGYMLFVYCKNRPKTTKVSVQKRNSKPKGKNSAGVENARADQKKNKGDVENPKEDMGKSQGNMGKPDVVPSEKPFTDSRPQSRFGPPSGRNSRVMMAHSFTPENFSPAVSTTPPRTPKGSVRFVESRLSRLNAGMESPATPPPSHREALRSSTITIASVNSKNRLLDDMGNPETPVIFEDVN